MSRRSNEARRPWIVGALAILSVAGVLLASPLAFGETYRWVDRDGSVRYTDRPPQPGEAMPAPAASSPAPTPPPPALRELLELSGVRQQLEWLAVSTRSQMQAPLGALEAEERAAVDHVASQAFGAERLHALVHESLNAHLDDAKLAQALTWYRSAPGRKIAAAELVAGMPKAQQEFAAYARTRAANPPEPARLQRLERLDLTAGISEFTFDAILAASEGLRRAIEPFLSIERRRAMAGADREAAAVRAQAVQTLRTAILVNAEFSYRDVSDADLDAYLSFLGSPSGRWLIAEIHRALLHAIRTATQEAMVAIVSVIPPRRWGRGRPPQAPEPKPQRL